jgi:hemoglobin/transferrin/lactoferrin receptor protein
LTANDIFRLKAAYFDMDVDNYITGCGSPVQFCNSPGTAAVQGVEIQGTYDAAVVFAGLSYTYTDTNLPSQLNGAGAHTYLPEHIPVRRGDFPLLDEKLTVGARVSYFSESYVGDINVGPPGLAPYAGPFMPGYTLVDLFTHYTFDSGFEIGATVVNLFETDFTPALTTPIVPFGPATPTNCFGSNLPNCSYYGRGQTC